MRKILALHALPLLLMGCANTMYVGTGTSVGIDVSGTTAAPVSMILGYGRTENILAPEEEDKTISSFSSFSLEHEWTKIKLSQFIAGGPAASDFVAAPPPPPAPGVAAPGVAAPGVAAPDVAAPDVAAPDVAAPDAGGQGTNQDDDTACKSSKLSKKRFSFNTGTKIGFSIDFSTPMHLMFGYKRYEVAVLPICERIENGKKVRTINSILASAAFETTSKDNNNSIFTPKTTLSQLVATGTAARNLASNPALRQAITDLNNAVLNRQAAEENKKTAVLNKEIQELQK